jgi:hypothetical protein
MKRLAIALLIVTVPSLAFGRFMAVWSYQELFDKADLVAIAKPISSKDTAERGLLPDGPKWDVVGLSTECEISTILKGDKNLKRCTIHHYRQKNPKEILDDGPSFVSFDLKNHPCYLLFLKKESDSRYAPVSGQTDPADWSILELHGFAY